MSEFVFPGFSFFDNECSAAPIFFISVDTFGHTKRSFITFLFACLPGFEIHDGVLMVVCI